LKKIIRDIIIDALNEYGGQANFRMIFAYVVNRKNEITLEAKDPQKTVRGIVSKMKKNNLIFRKGDTFFLKK